MLSPSTGEATANALILLFFTVPFGALNVYRRVRRGRPARWLAVAAAVALLLVMNIFAVVIAVDGATVHDYPVVAAGLGVTAVLSLAALGVWGRALFQ